MTLRVAINGYGRIGRNILRAHYESGKKHDLQIVAINDLGNAETNAHLTRYDTAHGRPHRDLVSPRGRLRSKRWLKNADFKEALTYAIEDFKNNHETYIRQQR